MGWKYLFYRVKTIADSVATGETAVKVSFPRTFFNSLFWNFGTITNLFDWNHCIQCKESLLVWISTAKTLSLSLEFAYYPGDSASRVEFACSGLSIEKRLNWTANCSFLKRSIIFISKRYPWPFNDNQTLYTIIMIHRDQFTNRPFHLYLT